MKKLAQKGFTLIEIAIVLVIVGLLLGAALKGQELIFNTKIKSTFNLSRELSAAMYGYQDRYKMVPGDDNSVDVRFPNRNARLGNGDGTIAGNNACAATVLPATTENCAALHHLRLAGFINGNAAQFVTTPFGGVAMMTSSNQLQAGTGSGAVMAHRTETLTNKIMSAIETSFDDGASRSGSVRCFGVTGYDLTNAEASLPAGWCMFNL